MKIPVLNRKEEYEYLVMHGLSHSFHRLQWLYDLEKYSGIFTGKEWTFLWKMKNTATARLCSNFFFKQSAQEKATRYLKHVIRIVNAPVPKFHIIRNWDDAYGRMLLTGSFKGWLSVLKAQMTSPKDWQIVKLHDKFFWMYFILRPFLSLKKLFLYKES